MLGIRLECSPWASDSVSSATADIATNPDAPTHPVCLCGCLEQHVHFDCLDKQKHSVNNNVLYLQRHNDLVVFSEGLIATLIDMKQLWFFFKLYKAVKL